MSLFLFIRSLVFGGIFHPWPISPSWNIFFFRLLWLSPSLFLPPNTLYLELLTIGFFFPRILNFDVTQGSIFIFLDLFIHSVSLGYKFSAYVPVNGKFSLLYLCPSPHPDLQIYSLKCLHDLSIWLYNRHTNHNMGKRKVSSHPPPTYCICCLIRFCYLSKCHFHIACYTGQKTEIWGFWFFSSQSTYNRVCFITRMCPGCDHCAQISWLKPEFKSPPSLVYFFYSGNSSLTDLHAFMEALPSEPLF